MNYEELVKSRKNIGDMTKEELFTYCGGLLSEVWDYEKENSKLETQLQQKENIIKEVREYITSYESIETIQQFDHNKNNKDLDYSTIDEMTRRYMMVHDKILKILDKEVISNE